VRDYEKLSGGRIISAKIIEKLNIKFLSDESTKFFYLLPEKLRQKIEKKY
jgi:hypothetical protein